uniref:F-box domain-containing protein n=1 Tax=Ditylenchus dipsaci TaxID=166011 RepID=A0A915E2G9_9BILA
MSIRQLPSESLLEVFAFIDYQTSLQLLTVCKRFHNCLLLRIIKQKQQLQADYDSQCQSFIRLKQQISELKKDSGTLSDRIENRLDYYNCYIRSVEFNPELRISPVLQQQLHDILGRKFDELEPLYKQWRRLCYTKGTLVKQLTPFLLDMRRIRNLSAGTIDLRDQGRSLSGKRRFGV